MKVVCKEGKGFGIGGDRFKIYSLTAGKTYDVVRQDEICYYLYNDNNRLTEVIKDFFDDLSDLRNKKINSILSL